MDWAEYRQKRKAIFDEYDGKLTRIAVAGLIGGGIRDIPADIDDLERQFEYQIYRIPVEEAKLSEHLEQLIAILDELKGKIAQLEQSNNKNRKEKNHAGR